MGCAVFFTGCTVRGPSVELPSVSIDFPVKVIPYGSYSDDHKHKGSHGKGCPPGLAKQGRC